MAFNNIMQLATAFNTKFVQLDHWQARLSGRREYYHFRKI